ncbi:enoyl-CoA hydratase/isomerase family protein [Streptoalloteichus tenebrarius]|uniref:enoyl-CoA hydratase/isomerase family protein n=1 Tax=Streptoalloteichus tenebrarius (strain ATCC 17920 / DSM 40477 / JCM 4838 / CBS 697.72 / NBRC 16177 / NCIMB 11028 / NRRL B-12390 / A12253. 1 / ISP 5477) TaxID=1933 RepID=UPI0020A61165|nr:enoyl-CoA hydratase/isomerase family protein [Streptoalloteichus tenebrarius]
MARGGVRLDVEGARATITLDRQEVLNAQTPLTWEALRAVGEGLGPEVRVVVVRGAGRSFSAGLDRRLFTPEGFDGVPGLFAMAAEPRDRIEATIAEFQQGFAWLRDPARVTVAAVHGHAIGAGFQLALACDLRVLAEDARLRMAETSLGIVPDLGGTLPLVRCVGYARAVEICVTGREVDAEEALRIGLANRVVPADQLDEAVDDLVARLLRPPAGAVRETVALLAHAESLADAGEDATGAEGGALERQRAAERAAQARRLADLAAAVARG